MNPGDKLTETQRQAIESLFKMDNPPAEFYEFLKSLEAIHRAVRAKLATVLEPRLNTYLSDHPATSFKDRYDIALFLDQTTSNLGLCATHEGKPALLVAERSRNPQDKESHYAMLQPVHTRIGFQRVGEYDAFPRLELVAAPDAIHEALEASRRCAYDEPAPRRTR